MIKTFFYICSFLLFFAHFLYGKVSIEMLAKEKTWLSLLHYDPSGVQSSILNQDFFLSKEGRTDPLAELYATLQAYNEGNRTILCKYPARYYWLHSKITLNDYEKREAQCQGYHSWELITDTHAISVFFVSGFLGNPASAFGHSFIRLKKSNIREDDLLSNTLSYGAKLPDRYSMLSYIYNGITGGYEASYSDEYYYMNDMTYSNQEFRQMWEYDLNLSEEQKKLLLLHLWELRGIRFRYYFFNRNCGYKVSELLDIVSHQQIRDKAYIWYAPIETFFRLESINGVIGKIHYHPSAQQNIYAFYKGLNRHEKVFVSQYIKNEGEKTDLSTAHQASIKTLDFLLDYYTYQMQSLDKKSEAFQKSQEIKYKLLQQRLVLPKSRYQKPKPKQKLPITSYQKPTRIGMGLHIDEYSKRSLMLNFSPFVINAVGYDTYGGDILNILNTTVLIRQNKITLDHLDFLHIRRLKTEQLPFDIDNPLSWELAAGIEKQEKNDYYISAGIGYTWETEEHFKWYLFDDISAHTQGEHYRMYPHIGLFIDYDKVKIDMAYGKENYCSSRSKFFDKGKMEISYHPKPDQALFFEFNKEMQSAATVGLRYYF
jgi:hypothetical protein